MHDISTKTAKVSAPAKINLCLLVGPRRADGYHPVCSLMEKIRLFDNLRTMREVEGTGIRLSGSEIPPAENIVMKAARALEGEIGEKLDVDIELKKEIPAAAGLGGGSSDAAAILKLLVFMFGLDVPAERLRALAFPLGADVPFFLAPGPQLARGVGEALTAVSGLPDYSLVLVKPPFDLVTAKVYGLFDEMGGATADFQTRCNQLAASLAGLVSAESTPTADLLPKIMQNDLEPSASAIFPELAGLKEEILAAGALGALMSGSGSSVFGVFSNRESAETAVSLLRTPRRQVWVTEPFRD